MDAMRVELLVIGHELLDGRVADTNTLRFATKLSEVGLQIAQRTTVPDDVDDIVRELGAIVQRGASLCLISGGLGPTTDDLTAEAFAQFLGESLAFDEKQAVRIREMIEARGREVTSNQYKQAYRPESAILLPNPVGTAPGFEVTHAGCRFVSVPGVPREFDSMVDAAILTPLSSSRTARPRAVLRTFGLFEAEVAARLAELETRWPSVVLGYRAHFPEIHVSLSVDEGEGDLVEEAIAYASEVLGEHVFGDGGASLAGCLLNRLKERGATLAIAESCTGGLVADMVTDVPGASAVLLESIVAYANRAKVCRLGVETGLIEDHGAVSEEVVLAMAQGMLQISGATCAIATSGIAGPTGGTVDKPVGTVWIAAISDGFEEVRKMVFPFDRRRNKVLSAYSALDLLRRALS